MDAPQSIQRTERKFMNKFISSWTERELVHNLVRFYVIIIADFFYKMGPTTANYAGKAFPENALWKKADIPEMGSLTVNC